MKTKDCPRSHGGAREETGAGPRKPREEDVPKREGATISNALEKSALEKSAEAGCGPSVVSGCWEGSRHRSQNAESRGSRKTRRDRDALSRSFAVKTRETLCILMPVKIQQIL